MAGLHSELYAIDANGRLHGWVWSCPVPMELPHPLEVHLGVQEEKITMIAGRFMRASILTDSGKVMVGRGGVFDSLL